MSENQEESLFELEKITFPRPLCDEEVMAYFHFLASVIPVIVELTRSERVSIGRRSLLDKTDHKGPAPVSRRNYFDSISIDSSQGGRLGVSLIEGRSRDEDETRVLYREARFNTGLYDLVAEVPKHHIDLLRQVRMHSEHYLSIYKEQA